MTEVFDALSVIGDPMEEENRVIHLFAGLPESFNMLVTALEANSDVPTLETVTERLLHEERKRKDRGDGGTSREREKAMVSTPRRLLKCHHCGRVGHIKRNCWNLASEEPKTKPRNEGKGTRQKVNKAAVNQMSDSSSGGENDALVACHALLANAASNWIVDSGATCHMCSDGELFQELQSLKKPVEVTFGDGHMLNATGRGTVSLKMKLPTVKQIIGRAPCSKDVV